MKQADGELGDRKARERGKNRPTPQGVAEGAAIRAAKTPAKKAPAKKATRAKRATKKK